MQRVAIVGCGGAGKSVLARKLGELTGIEVFHLDALLWRPGWVMTPKDEELALQQALIVRPTWIIDGNYGGTQPVRLEAADTIVFLDLSRWICLWRVVKRTIRYHRKTRPDMGPDCPERVDLGFWKWIWDYPAHSRPRTVAWIEQYREGRRIEVLNSPREVQAFLDRVRAERVDPVSMADM